MTIKKKVRKESAFRCRVLFCVLFMGHLVSIIVYRDKKERSNENLNSTCTLKNDLYDDFEE